jgi:phosphoglycolate phosphatase
LQRGLPKAYGIRSCDITLKQFGMDGCFDRIETGSSEKNRKSEAMKAISLYYGFKSNEMIYVGDAVSDIEACYSVKIQCLSAAWAASTDCEQLEKYNSGYVFSSVRLLRDFLLC